MTQFKVLMHDNKFVADIGIISSYGRIAYTETPQLLPIGITIDSIVREWIISQPHWTKKHKKIMANIIQECTLESYILCTPNEYRQ